jgi:hypothetical protein
MKKTDVYRGLSTELTLREPAGAPLTVRLVHLSSTRDEQCVIECSATFRVDAAQYRQIDPMALFGLDPARRGPMQYARSFDPSADVEIEVALAPEVLAQSAFTSPTAFALAECLLTLPADSPVLATTSWAALAVTQEIDGRRNGYRMYRSGVNLFDVLGRAQNTLGDMETVTASMIEQAQQSIPIFAALYQYFTSADWDFALDDAIPALLLRYRGQNGEWDCVAEAHDDDAQFIFYSECPVSIPAEKRPQLMEFLGRANSGLVIGNFEMDLNTGLVRFRTSLDVMGARLDHALVHNVVRWSVGMMDHYLPGIHDILAGKTSAAEAILAIEGQRA